MGRNVDSAAYPSALGHFDRINHRNPTRAEASPLTLAWRHSAKSVQQRGRACKRTAIRMEADQYKGQRDDSKTGGERTGARDDYRSEHRHGGRRICFFSNKVVYREATANCRVFEGPSALERAVQSDCIKL
jgi:hypothetical protein